MTEVPEHLLQRSRDRRKALGLEPAPGDTGAPTPDVAPEVTANTPAVVGDAGAAGAAATAKVPVPIPDTAPPPPEDPVAPWVTAANDRQKIPAWVMPVLLFLPIWAFMYVGTLESPSRSAGLLYEGGEIYAENCASCHGAGGGGGSGPGFTGGAIIETFPRLEDQIEWVVKGTAGFEDAGRVVYGATEKEVGGGGVMPSFADTLTAEELTLAVLYERIELGGYSSEELLGEALFDHFEHDEILDADGNPLEHFEADTTIGALLRAFEESRVSTESAAG